VKKTVLFGIISSCFVLTMFIAANPIPVFAQEKNALVPMDLDETEWAVEVVSVNKKGKKVTTEDTLIFENKQFTSEYYKKKGYDPTNYSLTVSEDDVTSFGTMQIKGKETSFWKGQVTKDQISGSIHVQRSSGNNVTYYYTGELLSGTLVRKGESKTATQPPPPSGEPEKSMVEKVKDAVKKAVDQGE